MKHPRRSLRLIALLALGLAAARSGGSEIAEATLAAPRAIAPDPLFDAGTVGRGVKVRHDFELHNEGTAELFVREVQPTCGCTVAKFDESIAPGGRGLISVELDTETFRGPIAKDVTVLTSDPANPAIVLTVRADVQPWVDAQPGYFRFIHVEGGEPQSALQTVWSADRPDLVVLAVESPLPALSVSFREARPDERAAEGQGRQWVIGGTLAPEAPPGPLSGDVRVRTNHPQQPELLLPIAGYVRPVLMVSPPAAEFGSFSPSEPRRGSVLVTNFGTAPIRLLSVESDVKGLSAQIAEREKGKRFDLNLTVAAGVPPGPLSGTLRVHTDSPRNPVFEIPVKGEVR